MTGDSDDDTIVEDETVTDAAKHRQSERADHVTAMIGDEAAGLLEDRTYPTTSEELAQEYATHPVELPNETESLGSVFDRLDDEEYTSPEEAQQAAAEAIEASPETTPEPFSEGDVYEDESTRFDTDTGGTATYEDEPHTEATFEESEIEETDVPPEPDTDQAADDEA